MYVYIKIIFYNNILCNINYSIVTCKSSQWIIYHVLYFWNRASPPYCTPALVFPTDCRFSPTSTTEHSLVSQYIVVASTVWRKPDFSTTVVNLWIMNSLGRIIVSPQRGLLCQFLIDLHLFFLFLCHIISHWKLTLFSSNRGTNFLSSFLNTLTTVRPLRILYCSCEKARFSFEKPHFQFFIISSNYPLHTVTEVLHLYFPLPYWPKPSRSTYGSEPSSRAPPTQLTQSEGLHPLKWPKPWGSPHSIDPSR